MNITLARDMIGQPFNRCITVEGGKHYILGPFFVCRQDGPEFTSIEPDDLVRLTAYISNHHVIVIEYRSTPTMMKDAQNRVHLPR